MEVISKSPTQPDRLLHDALAEDHSETLSATTSSLPNKLLSKSLAAFQTQESLFRLTLTNINFNWTFTLKELCIIQDASEGLYMENDIEGAFYEHGGYPGIIALILFFRKSGKIQRSWAAIIEEFRERLVKRVVKMLNREILEWIPEYLSAPLMLYIFRTELHPHPLYYLGTHAGRKRKRDISETAQARCPPSPSRDTSVSQQSQEIHQIGQAVASRPRNQQNFQSHQDAHVSSPEQNLPQQQYRKLSNTSTNHDIASTPHQHITTSRSNASEDLITAPSVYHTNLPLPVLLYSLGCSQIRQDILFRGLLPQKRWDDRGNVHEVRLRDAGFNEQIICLFSNRSELEQTIRSCIQLGFIVQSVLGDGSLVYSISNQSQHQIPQSCNREELDLLGLMFTTHIYPRDKTLEATFQDTGKLLLPYLERTWEFVQREPRPTLPTYTRDSLVEASLATYQLLGPSRKKDLISVLAKIQGPELPDYLRMAIADRKSISLRFKGDHDQSDVIIQDILGSIAIDSKDIRSYCAYGRLLLSRAENAILRKEFSKAESYLASWEVKHSDPSGPELQVVRLKNTVLGRVFRYEGDFPHARHCLEKCLQTIPGDASRYHIMHHLGDVYCELGVPGEVEKLVLDEINQLRARCKQQSKAFRRLALPLAEAYILQMRLQAAEAVLRELLDIFEGMVGHDISDQLNHVRSMIGLARVSWQQARWSEARQTLKSALGLTGKYRTFSKGNYYIGVIYLFLSVVNFELHKYLEGQSTLASAQDIFSKEIPRHFMPGMGSYFLQNLSRTERSLQWPRSSINETQLSTAFNRAQMI